MKCQDSTLYGLGPRHPNCMVDVTKFVLIRSRNSMFGVFGLCDQHLTDQKQRAEAANKETRDPSFCVVEEVGVPI